MAETSLDQYWPEGDVREVAIFKTLCAILKSDSVLASIPITWVVWDGTPGEAKSPATAELPWIRLTPVRSRQSLGTEREWELLFRVKFEIVTSGTNYSDLGNLSGYFVKALKYRAPYQGTTVINALRSAGAITYDFEEASSSPYNESAPVSQPSQPSPPQIVDFGGVGSIVFQVYVDADK